MRKIKKDVEHDNGSYYCYGEYGGYGTHQQTQSHQREQNVSRTSTAKVYLPENEDIKASTATTKRRLSEHHYFSIPELDALSFSQSVSISSAAAQNYSLGQLCKDEPYNRRGTTVGSSFRSCRSKTSRDRDGLSNGETSIIGARASVMIYDDAQKKWVPSGTSTGLSKVQIYHHQQNNTFRVVGRKLQDHEVVINCSILKGLKYNQATATFHQWRDSKYVYGLNFSTQQDAEGFARAMLRALEVLSGKVIQPGPQAPTNGNYQEEDMGYRTMTREDAAILQQQQQLTGPVAPSPQTPTSQSNQNIPQSPPTPQGHHRTSSAPPAPQPPPMSMPPQMYGQAGGGSMPIQQQQPQPPQQPPAPPQMQYQANQHHPSYSSQPVNNSYTNQYQQPIYVSSSSNQSLNQQLQQAPPPPPHQNGPIYVSSSAQGIPSSASSNSVVYASQQQQQQPPPQTQIQSSQPNIVSQYGQPNGPSTISNETTQYGQIPMAPPMSSMPGNSVPIPPAGVPILRAAPPAPQAPPPPPMFGGPNFAAGGPPQPPAPPAQPPAPPSTGAAPPPPPPPPMGGLMKKDDSGSMDMSSFAAQLQSARLKRNNKTTPPPAENSGSSTSSGGSGNYGTIGRTSKGMASMMDEMAKTLARRRAQAEKKEPDPSEDNQQGRQRPWEKSNTLPHKLGAGSSGNTNSGNGANANSGSESPRPIRKRFGSASEETILKQVNGEGLSLALSADLDSLKAEIVREIRFELQKTKQEIIDAIKTEFNRR